MKKVNVLLGTLLIASTSALTSCFSNDIPGITITGAGGSVTGSDIKVHLDEDDIIKSAEYTYTIHVNGGAQNSEVQANITVNGVSVGTGVSVARGSATIGKTLNIVATKTSGFDNVRPDVVEKTVVLDAPGKQIYLNFTVIDGKYESASTTTDKVSGKKDTYTSVSVDDAVNLTKDGGSIYVVNTAENQASTNIVAKGTSVAGGNTVATMTISSEQAKSAATKPGGDNAFKVSVSRIEGIGIEQNLEDVIKYWFPVIDVKGKPDGADFSADPIPVKVENKNILKAMAFQCVNSDGAWSSKVADVECTQDKSMIVKIPHFSDWTISTQVDCIRKKGDEYVLRDKKIYDFHVLASLTQTFNYNVRTGWESNGTINNEFVVRFLNAKFGAHKGTDKTSSITITNTNPENIIVPYTITQERYTYQVRFNDLEFEVYVWGDAQISVDPDEVYKENHPAHSGGAGY